MVDAKVPPALTGEIATTRDGRDITQPWIRELQEARDPRLWRSVDWGVYDRVLLDDQVKACLEQRIRAVVSRDWDVLAGDAHDDRSKAAAAAFSDQLKRIGWDRVTEKMLYATFNGFAVAELIWAPSGGLIGWENIRVRHARRFRFDADGGLRLLTRVNMMPGEPLPPRKFWTVASGGSDDDHVYGRGLAEWLYWPTLFKRNGVRFWNIFLDKFSVPTAKGSYPIGTSQADQNKLLAAVQAIAVDSGFIVPAGMVVELLQLAGTGADFAGVCRYMDGAISKIILSQTMTTDHAQGRGGLAQGKVHSDVKEEIVKADADLLSDGFNAGPARWWCDLNFGADVASPRVVRVLDAPDDLKELADTDAVLAAIGWKRTAESFSDTYGDGYGYAPPPTPPQPSQLAPAGDVGEPGGNVVPIRAAAFAEAEGGRDVVDAAVDAAMADEGWRATLGAIVEPLAERLRRAASADDVTAILTEEAGAGDDAALTEALARAGFATRLDALTSNAEDGA